MGARSARWVIAALLTTVAVLAWRRTLEHLAASSSAVGDRVHHAPSLEVAPPAVVRLVPVVGGLDRPLFVTDAGDGSSRLFVVEQSGKIRIVRDGGLLERPFVDLGDRFDTSRGERGLLGLAFAPDFERSGLLFVAYTVDSAVVVASLLRDAGDPEIADPSSLRQVLKMDDPASNHNGGMLAFGPDRRLWVGTGDGGGGGDPWNNAQDLGSLLGKILRLDVGYDTYKIPADNPFVGRRGARGEIWAFGLRNPWRFSFDRSTGELWIGDVGQNAWEEIDVENPVDHGGKNYGWRRLEGNHCFRPRQGCESSGTALPVHEYGHDKGCSVTGGYVYRGRQIPALVGWYLFGDYCRGTVWALRRVEGRATEIAVLLESGAAISSFGEDADGEVYLCDWARGAVSRLAADSEVEWAH